MLIGVNGRFLTKPYTGIGQHTRGLFGALARLEDSGWSEVKILMVVPEAVDIEIPEDIEIHVLPETFIGTAGMRKTFWEQVQLPKFFRARGVDLVHFPYPSNPWRGFSKPVCVTVHDTIPWENAAYRRSISTRTYQNKSRAAVKKADHVFTVSEASKVDVIRLCGVDESRISLSYNAPAPYFFARDGVGAQSIDTFSKANAVLKKYGLDPGRRYFFYLGGYDERKNVRTLIEAFTKFIAPHYDLDLVLAGGKAVAGEKLYASFDEVLQSHRAGSGSPGRGVIRTTGFVDEKDLPALYQSAFAFVNVSTQEGCNLPLLEALSSGVPVIASDIPVHREMVGGDAVFVNAKDTETLGAMMDRFLRDEQFYHSRKQIAKNYRCPFSWEASARKVLEVYQKLLKA